MLTLRKWILVSAHVVWSPAALGPTPDVRDVPLRRQGYVRWAPVEPQPVRPAARTERRPRHRSEPPNTVAPATHTQTIKQINLFN